MPASVVHSPAIAQSISGCHVRTLSYQKAFADFDELLSLTRREAVVEARGNCCGEFFYVLVNGC